MRRWKIIFASLAATAAASVATGADAVNFTRDIRPILSENCFACHGPDEKERKAGLRLDDEAAAKRVKDGIVAVVAGKPEQSDLIKRITTTDADDVMPPPKTGKKLTPKQIELFRQWIAQGAKWGGHWAYEKPVRHALPPLEPWAKARAKNPIDHFLFARLAKEKLRVAPEADRHTLVRRVTLDLTGLPPTLTEVEAFLKDTRVDAYERLVDRLLAKPAYGEHWARMWLDLARYADSAGYADDPARTIWAYRDYVINAFNGNKPFDQFTREQLAGDLLPGATEEQLIATAFHRNTMTNSEGGTNDEEWRNAAVVDRVNTTMAVWMGSSLACAQCHTHKYDPITQREYFQFFAFLNNTADSDKRDEAPLLEFFTDEQKRQRTAWQTELAGIEAKFKTPSAAATAAAEKWTRSFPFAINWNVPVPESPKAKSGAPAIVLGDRAVSIEKNDAVKDTITIELPFAEAQKISALRLETMPNAGHAAGNFVLTRVRAILRPPADVAGTKARFIRLELPGKQKTLQIAEVQVFAGAENVARTGTASLSSTYIDAAASRAIDGRTDGEYEKGSVAHSGQQDNPWWEVDLKAARAIDRIVIWNRAEMPERLAGFRIVALDEQRKVVWEKASNDAPPRSVELALNGEREIRFGTAIADFTQANFDAENVVNDDAPKKDRTRGWSVGGAVNKEHTLTLIAAEPIVVPAGARLVVTLDHQSSTAKATLSRFRLGVTADAEVVEHMRTPAEVLAAIKTLRLLAAPTTGAQGDAMRQRITDYYARNIWPESKVDREKITALTKQIAELKPNTVPIFRELAGAARRKTHLQFRGSFQDLGEEVSEGVPAALHPLPAGAPRNRLTLAEWLVAADNPLTARVLANRYWEEIFGVGLVRTAEEFGAQGELPAHPELLDWLATELHRMKWDLKAFTKLLVTSAAYQQSARATPELLERDPENRLLARGPRFRMPAEMVRDQVLAVSGLLSAKLLGPSVRPPRPVLGLNAAFGRNMDWETSAGEDRYRRALYTEARRTSPYPSMSTFDAPSREVCTIRRSRTNTPLQALVTLNDPVYVEAAQALARRIVKEGGATDVAKANHAVQLCLSRPASETEVARLVKLHAEMKVSFTKDPEAAAKLAAVPAASKDAVELAAWTTVANVLLNLDEMFMKR